MEPLGQESVQTIAELIRLTIAPVFMLAGVSGFLNVFTGRLARIIDRLEKINQIYDAEHWDALPDDVQIRKISLMKRMKNTNRAILLMSTTGLLIAFVMLTMFLSATFGFQDGKLISYLYMGSIFTFIMALSLFTKEILDTVSSAQVRSGFIP